MISGYLFIHSIDLTRSTGVVTQLGAASGQREWTDGSHMTGCDAELREGKEKGGKDGCIAQERNKHAETHLR